MTKRDDAKEILTSLGLPRRQQNERSCLTLLALAELVESTEWSKTKRPLLRIVDIMAWMRDHFDKDYAPNSRETIRRQTIHQFEQAQLVNRNPGDPSRPTNSGNTVYQLTTEATRVIKSFGKRTFASNCRKFIEQHGKLSAAYDKARDLKKVSATLPGGKRVKMSPGKHNDLQRQIVEHFAPRFAPGSVVLYLGDTANKRLVIDKSLLSRLKIPEMKHDKLPDVVLYDENRKWIFLVEAVTTHGPISPKRYKELEAVFSKSPCERVYVTAFPDFTTFKKYVIDIVWESEVWIADNPDHMIHFNGDKFLGPYPTQVDK